jgi:predicted metal-binding membrane protein
MLGAGAATKLEGQGDRAVDLAFLGWCALLFFLSAATTVACCGSMGGGMPMPGGWTMSMAWMRMPGQSWREAAATFMAMWVVMMAAMMLPSLASMLSSYRRCLRVRGGARLARSSAHAGAGYFFVWAVVGAAVYPLGIGLAAAEMRWSALARGVPLATGFALLLAGGAQLSTWKLRQLGRCRDTLACGGTASGDARAAWRHGLRLGLHCARCCAGLIAALLVAGVMDLRVMAAVTAAITVERVAPWPERSARAIGWLVVAAGVFTIALASSAGAGAG